MELLIMSSGFIASNGKDLDDIFHPRESGDPIHSSNTGYAVGSQDLRNRYWPLSDNGTAPSSPTGYRVGSTDLQNIFAEIDTVSQEIDLGLGTYYTASGVNDNSIEQIDTTAFTYIIFQTTGDFVVTSGWSPDGGSTGAPTTGTWLPSGKNVSDIEFLLDYQIILDGISTEVGTNMSSTEWRRADSAPLSFGINDRILNVGTSSTRVLFTVSVREVGSSNITVTEITLEIYLDFT